MNHSITSRASVAAMLAILVLSTASTASAATFTRELQLGMSGSDVSALQTYLAADASIYPQGLVTGYFGALTKAAVARFQTQNGIAAVGRVGPVTLAALNSRMGGETGTNNDNTAPIISNVSVTATTTGAIVRWNTNELAAGIVYYSAAPVLVTERDNDVDITGTSVTKDSILHTSHEVVITGLKSNATYNYVIYVKDAFGNVQFTWPLSFKVN